MLFCVAALLLTLSSESRNHGLYFWAIVKELTDTAVAIIALVVRFVKNTSIDVSSRRTDMRYAPYLRFGEGGSEGLASPASDPRLRTHQYIGPSYFSK